MKAFAKNKATIILALICLMLSISILCFSIFSIVYAEETTETENTEIQETEDITKGIKDYITEIITLAFGSVDTFLSLTVLLKVAAQKKQSMSVTVNDENTQKRLDALAAENSNLKDMLMAAVTLEKNTQEILKTLFAENPSIDDKIKNVINTLAINSDSVIKDVTDIVGTEAQNNIKKSLSTISNILLG